MYALPPQIVEIIQFDYIYIYNIFTMVWFNHQLGRQMCDKLNERVADKF